MLSAWFRIKFPHVVTAALAASAPILVSSGFGSKPSFFETTTTDFADANVRYLGFQLMPTDLPSVAAMPRHREEGIHSGA